MAQIIREGQSEKSGIRLSISQQTETWDDALQEAHHYYSLVLIESAQANAAANFAGTLGSGRTGF